ncbi:DUF2797 domain-containing protein [Streptomyces sp. NPDC004042]|uniref:DUF2797 domain-containing protein n=1 Tax=Streptomyces sp. NPDC004042 TaxID=3154451 RepID=UPI0033A5453B
MDQVWRCAGLWWAADGPVLAWQGGRTSALPWGKRVAFEVAEGGVRTCVGARGYACPLRAAVPGRSTGARCEECARLDRAHSVAADTVADDPRPYHVYLAWFGPGLTKVGITAVERGPVRLLEQGAICFSWLGAGPLMAARRTEELLRAALGVPDRIPYAAKRAVRSALDPDPAARAAEISALHERAGALADWPESLERKPFRPVDHVGVYGLGGRVEGRVDGRVGGRADGRVPEAVAEVSELVAGGAVSGALVAAAGPDLHLAHGSGAVVLDTRLMTGWPLGPAEGGTGGGDRLTVPVRDAEQGRARGVQDGLF